MPDETNQRIGVIFLGLIALMSIVCGTYLLATDHAIPDAFIALGSAAGGALAMLIRPGQ